MFASGLVDAPTINRLKKQLHLELTEIHNWMEANKLTLNTSKSHALIIYPKLRFPSVNLNLQCPAGRRINAVKKPKYLGIILDNQLNFADHIKIIETKVARSVVIHGKLSYYLPSSAMLQLYYSLVHSNLLYGVVVWGNTFPYLAKLTRLQKKEVRLVISSDWNVSAAPLFYNIMCCHFLN